ncbi:MAG: hypothetical protein MHPSP_003093 [Paramarteilia canceri]
MVSFLLNRAVIDLLVELRDADEGMRFEAFFSLIRTSENFLVGSLAIPYTILFLAVLIIGILFEKFSKIVIHILGAILIVYSLIMICMYYVPGVVRSIAVKVAGKYFDQKICLSYFLSYCPNVDCDADTTNSKKLNDCLKELLEGVKKEAYGHIYIWLSAAASIGIALAPCCSGD